MKEISNRKIRSRKEKAQGMVEFAMTLPILLLLFFGIIEFGRLLFFYSVVVTSAREAARYGSAAGNAGSSTAYFQDCDGIRAAALRVGNLVGLQNNGADITITYDDGPGTGPIGLGCPVSGTGPALDLGNRIIVTVNAAFQPIVPIVNVPPIVLQSEAKRTILTGVVVE
jgi:Flp pilus assembly protein TadG